MPGITRRGFLAGSLAAVALTRVPRARAAEAAARVALVEDSRATLGPTRIDPAVVESMVKEALRLFAGGAPRDALAARFKPGEKVAIKVNALGCPYSIVNPITALTLARLLVEAGLSAKDIRIFDQYTGRMRMAGYHLGRTPEGFLVTGPDGADPAVQTYVDGRRTVRFHWARSLTWADGVINVCVPKDHDLAGVTGALKNVAFGSVRPTADRERQPNGYTVVPAFHAHNADPAIATLYARPEIRDRVRLVVCDATRVLYHGGPKDSPFRARNDQILVSLDPVAIDALILEMVDRHRVARRLRPIENDPRRPPRFLATAARLGLGVADRSRIEVARSKLG